MIICSCGDNRQCQILSSFFDGDRSGDVESCLQQNCQREQSSLQHKQLCLHELLHAQFVFLYQGLASPWPNLQLASCALTNI